MAQNLVPNPSFEMHKTCPTDLNNFYNSEIVDSWYSPTKATPDYYNACSRFNVSVPVNAMGTMFACEGNGYMGIILLEKPDYRKYGRMKPYDYREYIQCKMIKPLSKDSSYLVSFSYCIAPYCAYVVPMPFAYVSVEPIHASSRVNLEIPYPVKSDTLSLENISGQWLDVADTIKATGGEQYLTIGSFTNDSQTPFRLNDLTRVPSTNIKQIQDNAWAYYYIDCVELVPIKPNGEE
jgi:OOP family OmpA-OmpF porin